MSAAAEAREAQRHAARRARDDVARLAAERDWLTGELGRVLAGSYLGGGEVGGVEEIEADLARVERDLRRAEAAAAYLAV